MPRKKVDETLKNTSVSELFLFENNKIKIEGNYCKSTEIAKWAGLTVRRIQQLTQEGIIQTVDTSSGKRYDFFPTTQRLYKYWSDAANGKDKTEREKSLKELKLQAEINLKESQAELHKLKADIFSGKYISCEEVTLDYMKFFIIFKKFALSMPNRVSGLISGHCDPMEVRKIESDLNDEITGLLKKFHIAGCKKED